MSESDRDLTEALRPVIGRAIAETLRTAPLFAPGDDPFKGSEWALEIEESKGVGQITSIKAKPGMKWVANKPSGYHCHGDTIVKVKLSDGTEQEHNYRDGTFIPVTDGLIHFPPDNGPV
jgi:hypothetical protein